MCNVRLRICIVGDETQRRVTDDEENLKQSRITEQVEAEQNDRTS